MEAQPESADRRAGKALVPLAIWTLVWLASLALAQFGPSWWGDQPVITWIVIGVNIVLGVGWIVAHARWLGAVDDLQRKIFTDALAIALGVGLIGGFAYATARQTGLVSFDADIALVSVVMGVTYLVSIAVGNLRYR